MAEVDKHALKLKAIQSMFEIELDSLHVSHCTDSYHFMTDEQKIIRKIY